MCSITFFFVALISGFAVFFTFSEKQQAEFRAYPARIYFWNRDLPRASKTKSSSIINWRTPNINLSPDEYLMGVELAKGNHCHHFVIDNEVSRKAFCRCVHFFPEMKEEYSIKYSKKTKEEFEKVCPN